MSFGSLQVEGRGRVLVFARVGRADLMNPLGAPAPETQSTTSLIDKWYQALDGRRINVGPRCWRALVSGIHVHGNNLWIQIAHADNSNESLVLCVPREIGIDSVIAAESPWIPLEAERHVMHVVRKT